MANGHGSVGDVLHLQRQIGNQAVGRLLAGNALVQRQVEDAEKIGEAAPGVAGAEQAVNAVAKPERINEDGDIDGGICSDVQPHAFTNEGKTGEGTWHHCAGGTGGKGVYNTGAATLVAPVYKTSPAPQGGQAKAWIKKGTGTVTVKRAYLGVTHGDQGDYTAFPGNLWMSPRAMKRMDEHEEKHTKKTKEIYEKHIEPLEDRISKYRGIIKAKKAGTSAKAAKTALKAEIDWNKAVKDFADEDTTENKPMGPVDTTDQARADFYQAYYASAKFKKSSGNKWYMGLKGQQSKKGRT
jgi:hypothetical protein